MPSHCLRRAPKKTKSTKTGSNKPTGIIIQFFFKSIKIKIGMNKAARVNPINSGILCLKLPLIKPNTKGIILKNTQTKSICHSSKTHFASSIYKPVIINPSIKRTRLFIDRYHCLNVRIIWFYVMILCLIYQMFSR